MLAQAAKGTLGRPASVRNAGDEGHHDPRSQSPLFPKRDFIFALKLLE